MELTLTSALAWLGAILGTGLFAKLAFDESMGFTQGICWGLAAGLCFFVLYVCGVTLIGVLFGLMRTSSGWIALRLFLVGMPAVLAYGLIGFASEAAGAIYKAAFLVLWAAPIVTLFYYWDPFLRWLAYRG
jgi:hypothetical protein